MTTKVVIYGAGGHAGEILWLISEINRKSKKFDVVGLLSDDVTSHGKEAWGFPILGGEDYLKMNPGTQVIVGIGNPATRFTLVTRIRRWVSSFPTLIHPDAEVSDSAEFAEGCVICSGTTVSVGVKVGAFTHFNINSYAAHGTQIGEYVTLGPRSNICGDVILGDLVDVGCNATVIQGISVGNAGIIGAGAVVLADTHPNQTYVGVPARALYPIKSTA